MTVRQPSKYLTRRQLAILAVGTFTLGVDGFVLAGLLPQVAADLHVAPATAGQLTTVFALTYAVASPIIATVTGRWDRRRVLLLGLAVFVVGLLGQALGPSFAVVLAGRIVAGVGAAAFQSNAYGMAGLLSSAESRPRSLAVVVTGGSIAQVVGVPFGVVIGQHWGWRGAVWVLIALAVVSAGFVVALPSAYAPPASLASRLRVLVRPTVLMLLLASLLVLIPFFLALAYLPPLIDSRGWLVVAATMACGLGQVVGLRLVPRLVTRFGGVRTVAVGSVACAAVFGVLAVGRGNVAAALVLLVGSGLCSAAVIVPQQNRIFALMPDIAVVVMGLNGSAIYLASAVGGGLGGLVLGGFGAGWLAPVSAAVAALAAAYTWTAAPERRTVRASDGTPMRAH